MLRRVVGFFAIVGLCSSSFSAVEVATKSPPYDIVVYGGTSGGIIAAVQAAKMKKSVVLIEPSKHLGGLTSGGLGATDIGNKSAIGGLSRVFYRRVAEHYAKDDAWKWEKRESYRSNRQAGESEMWTFEPHVAESIYREMLKEAKVPIVVGRLDLKNGVLKAGERISSIRLEGALEFTGSMFIDATYEGDLLAKAGVSGSPFARPPTPSVARPHQRGQRSRSNPSTSLPSPPRARSAPSYPPRAAFAARGGSAPETRCPILSRQPNCLLVSRLPFGVFGHAGP